MIEKYLKQPYFANQEDFEKNLEYCIPDNFNFGYDIVDEWARKEPDRRALLWTNDKGKWR